MFVKSYLPFLCLAEGEGGSGSGAGQQGQSGSGQAGAGHSGGGQQGSGQQQGSGSGGTGQGSGSGSGQQTGQQGQQRGGQGEKVEDLPDWAQKVIRDLRDEAAGNRTGKNQAEQQHQQTLDKIATALGLKGDDTKDPDKLAADLKDERDKTRRKTVELAVYRAAAQHDADPAALLDSRSFLDSLDDLDPNADDFGTRVGTRIADAVTKNSRLKISGPGGTAGGGRDMGQGRQGSQTGPTGVAAGRALRQARKGSRSKQTT